MRLPLVCIPLLLAAPAVFPQSGLAPEALLLAKVKLRAAENLERLPNYTCLETIERSRRLVSSRRFELIDMLRLEVGLVNRKELFAWPGSGEFTDQEISDMVGHGAIGNGSFAIHARSLFLSGTPEFTYIGERNRDGRNTVRWDYRVPLLHSGYRLRVKPLEAIVGYRGSVWVDAATLDLARIEIQVTEIPPHLPVSAASEVLEYQSVSIGQGAFLLPHTSALVIADLQGNESRNNTLFSNCRQFAGESVLSFGDAPETSAAPRPAPRLLQLPPDLEFQLELRTPIEAGTTAVGDALEAFVVKDVKLKNTILLPKGAKITGRVWKLERLQTPSRTEWVAGLLFQRFAFDHFYGELHARLVPPVPGSSSPWERVDSLRSHTIVREQPAASPRIGILNLKGERGKLPAGTRLYWRTLPLSREEKP
ncbi:MAG: hypothetical protein JNK48_14470 [Bryobacterales bacterium]|nr:hypothetical protein [Bryobacterales bacterium]